MPAHPDEFFGSRDTEKATTVPGSDRRFRKKGDINPGNAIDIERLREAMVWSRKKLQPFQDRYFDAVKHFAGSRYGDNNDIEKTAINLSHLAVEIWLRQLVAQTPRSLVLTRQPDLKTSAFELEIATDFLLRAIKFGDSLSEVVRSAIFAMGIMKVGITSEYLDEGSGFGKSVGQPYADHVLFEDWAHDMNARRKEEWDWCGNMFKLPYDLVMDNPDYDKKVRDQLRPRDAGDNDDLPSGNQSKTSRLSSDDSPTREEYRQHVELWDIWIPGNNIVITMPAQQGLGPLEVKEWTGPRRGPYHILGFSNVPGNVIPAAPAQNVYDLQDIISRLFNQMGRQALRQKTLTIADGRAVEDGTAERIMEGEDGQVIRTGHIDGVREMKYGGVDPGNQAYLVWLREIFSYLGGNIDAMGGLAQQAGTLGQEQLLVQSSSEMIRDMQAKVVSFTRDIVRDLAWYMYTDPQIELPLTKHIEGYGSIPFDWGPESRKAQFFDYSFDVQPYSLQHKGPAQRLQLIMQLTSQLFLPLAPQMEQFGLTLNLQKLVEMISKYSDLPELNDLISSELPTQHENLYASKGVGEKPKQSPITTRQYTRQSIPSGGTAQARNSQMIGQLMSAAKSNRSQ